MREGSPERSQYSVYFFRRAESLTPKKIVRFTLPHPDTLSPTPRFLTNQSPHHYAEPNTPETLRSTSGSHSLYSPHHRSEHTTSQEHTSIIAPRKNTTQEHTTTTSSHIYRIHITDNMSHHRFLIDTGAEISVLPPNPKERLTPSPSRSLVAANGTKIATYDQKTLNVDLGLKRKFPWAFIVADVSTPIIGPDFLKHYDLLVDSKRKRLIDNTEMLHIQSTNGCNKPTISTICVTKPFAEIIERYKDLTTLNTLHKPTKTVEHQIHTTGPPIFCHPRRLPLNKLREAQAEFRYMTEQGICQPSKSSWASPLHMVKKPNCK